MKSDEINTLFIVAKMFGGNIGRHCFKELVTLAMKDNFVASRIRKRMKDEMGIIVTPTKNT